MFLSGLICRWKDIHNSSSSCFSPHKSCLRSVCFTLRNCEQINHSTTNHHYRSFISLCNSYYLIHWMGTIARQGIWVSVPHLKVRGILLILVVTHSPWKDKVSVVVIASRLPHIITGFGRGGRRFRRWSFGTSSRVVLSRSGVVCLGIRVIKLWVWIRWWICSLLCIILS